MSEVTSAAPSADTSSNTPDTEVSVENKDTNVTQPPSLKERFKLTVDGEEFEEELDWNDKESVKNRLQLAAAAKKRMSEANEAKKKAYEIVSQFEKDPEGMLKRLGPKGREIAEKYLLEQIKEDMLTAEEKDQRAKLTRLEQLEKQEKEREEKAKAEAEAKKEFELAQNYQNTIIQALDKSGLPKSPELVKRMAKIMHKNLDYGLDLTPEELSQELKKEVTGLLKSVIGSSDGDQLIALFGEDVAKKIRMSDVKKLKEKQSMLFSETPNTNQNPPSAKENGKPMTMEEWKESINRRIGN